MYAILVLYFKSPFKLYGGMTCIILYYILMSRALAPPPVCFLLRMGVTGIYRSSGMALPKICPRVWDKNVAGCITPTMRPGSVSDQNAQVRYTQYLFVNGKLVKNATMDQSNNHHLHSCAGEDMSSPAKKTTPAQAYKCIFQPENGF